MDLILYPEIMVDEVLMNCVPSCTKNELKKTVMESITKSKHEHH